MKNFFPSEKIFLNLHTIVKIILEKKEAGRHPPLNFNT